MTKKETTVPTSESNKAMVTSSNWKKVLLIILQVIIIALATMGVIAVFSNSNNCVNIHIENWFSFMVSLIGVCTTLMVGTQLINFIEIKKQINLSESKIQELEQLKVNVENIAEKMEHSIKSTDVGNIFYLFSETLPRKDKENITLCLVYSLASIEYPYAKYGVIRNRLEKLKKYLSPTLKIDDSWKKIFSKQIENLKKIQLDENCPDDERKIIEGLKYDVISTLYTLIN